MTRETIGMTLLLFSAVVFFICATGSYLFGEIGVAITAFFMGIFGFLTYPIFLAAIYRSFVLVFGKGNIPWAWRWRIGLLLFSVFLIVHTATAEAFYGGGFGSYLSGCWNAAENGAAGSTGGGVLLGFIAYPVRALLSAAGAYVVFSVLTLVSLFLILLKTPLSKKIKGVSIFGGRRVEKIGNGLMKEDEEAEKEAAVEFDDLAPPVRRMPTKEEKKEGKLSRTLSFGAPSSREKKAPAPKEKESENLVSESPVKERPVSEKDESRRILFDVDPMDHFRNNLIFSRDSYFNSKERASSLYGQGAAAGNAGGSSERVDPRQSYSSRYASEAESLRDPVPRRVSEEKPAAASGYTYSPVDDISYRQTPSYHAQPQKMEPEKRNRYDHDVPYNEAFSTDAEALEPKKESRTFIPEPDFSNEQSGAPAPEQEKAEDFLNRIARESKEEKPQPKIDYNDSASIRSLFSRPAGDSRTDFSRNDRSENAFRTDDRSFARDDRDIVRDDDRSFARDDRDVVRDDDRTFARDDRGIVRDDDRSFARDDRDIVRDDDRTFARDDRDIVRDDDRTFARDDRDIVRDDDRSFARDDRRSAADLFDDDNEDEEEEPDTEPVRRRTPATYSREPQQERIAPPAEQAASAPAPKRHIYRQYIAPGYELFKDYNDTVMVPQEEIEKNSQAIEDTLAGFRIDAKVVKVTCGCTVTRYDLEIPGNISVNTVVKRDEEIAMRLHASDGVNVYANRANGTVSVDVPNTSPATVGLRPLLYANEYVNSKPGSLMFVIGKDVEGKPVIGNIVKMKHLLVAGTTGSGKSVCLHSLLISLICKYSPEDLRLILIDPKNEFTIYEGLPHLMINEIISDAQKAVTALNWAIKEMERRYALFQQKTRSGVLARNIDEYNLNLTEDEQKLCKIVIVVDELADLMSVAKKDIEERIQRLTQKSRAAGIHLVISTQRPSVDVITGVIKGNLPTRMALRVIQEVDSRTIIDESGAQKLLGNGDMLFRTEGMFSCMRVQGAFLSSKEVEQVVASVKANNEAYFDEEISDYINNPGQSSGSSLAGDDGEGDEVNEQYIKALGIVVKLGTASISLIQRKCSVGYNHAGKIIEWMELMGYISPFDGKAKARTVLLTKEEYESKYGSLD